MSPDKQSGHQAGQPPFPGDEGSSSSQSPWHLTWLYACHFLRDTSFFVLSSSCLCSSVTILAAAGPFLVLSWFRQAATMSTQPSACPSLLSLIPITLAVWSRNQVAPFLGSGPHSGEHEGVTNRHRLAVSDPGPAKFRAQAWSCAARSRPSPRMGRTDGVVAKWTVPNVSPMSPYSDSPHSEPGTIDEADHDNGTEPHTSDEGMCGDSGPCCCLMLAFLDPPVSRSSLLYPGLGPGLPIAALPKGEKLLGC